MASKKKVVRRVNRKTTASRPSARRHVSRAHSKKKVATHGLRQLYPASRARRSGWLRVSDIHEIYWEEFGNPRGKPAVFLHGGPGAGADKRAHRFFDPDAYRIVVFD